MLLYRNIYRRRHLSVGSGKENHFFFCFFFSFFLAIFDFPFFFGSSFLVRFPSLFLCDYCLKPLVRSIRTPQAGARRSSVIFKQKSKTVAVSGQHDKETSEKSDQRLISVTLLAFYTSLLFKSMISTYKAVTSSRTKKMRSRYLCVHSEPYAPLLKETRAVQKWHKNI